MGAGAGRRGAVLRPQPRGERRRKSGPAVHRGRAETLRAETDVSSHRREGRGPCACVASFPAGSHRRLPVLGSRPAWEVQWHQGWRDHLLRFSASVPLMKKQGPPGGLQAQPQRRQRAPRGEDGLGWHFVCSTRCLRPLAQLFFPGPGPESSMQLYPPGHTAWLALGTILGPRLFPATSLPTKSYPFSSPGDRTSR